MMKFLYSSLLLVALSLGAATLSGCPLLAVAGFGYSGYQYHEKEGVFAPGQPLGGSAPADKSEKSPKSSATPSSSNIE